MSALDGDKPNRNVKEEKNNFGVIEDQARKTLLELDLIKTKIQSHTNQMVKDFEKSVEEYKETASKFSKKYEEEINAGNDRDSIIENTRLYVHRWNKKLEQMTEILKRDIPDETKQLADDLRNQAQKNLEEIIGSRS